MNLGHFASYPFLPLSLFVVFLSSPITELEAQVAVSLGVQEIYDTNIFLEDDIGDFSPEAINAISMLDPAGQEFFVLPESQNGDPDSDIISNLTLGLNTGLDIGNYLRLGVDSTAGVALFGSFSEENRWTLDSLILLEPSPNHLPEYFNVNISSKFESGSYDVSVAEGTLARQSMRHIAGLDTDLNFDIDRRTQFNLGYLLQHSNFLGETTFSGDEKDLPEQFQTDEQGADFLQNTFTIGLEREFSEKTSAEIYADASLYSFSDEEDDETLTGSLDRKQYGGGVKVAHRWNQRLALHAGVGVEKTNYDEDPLGEEVLIISPDGLRTEIEQLGDDSPSNLIYFAGFDYFPSATTSFSANFEQSVGIDSKGFERAIRTFDANLGLHPIDRLALIAGTQYNVYGASDDFDAALKNFSSTLSAHYSLTESLNISGGWSITTQSSDEEIANGLLYTSKEYTSNRLFISLNKGFVGIL